MKYTNKNNLPSAIVAVCEEDDGHAPEEKVFHVTELLKPAKAAALLRKHYDEIEQDVSECIWLVFGKAVHSLMEKHDTTGYSEFKITIPLENGLTVVGRVDLYNEEECAVEDYKTATVWKVLYKDFEDWRKQGLSYAYGLALQGKLTKKLKFHALLKDWSARERKLALLQGKEYPESPIWTWEYEVTSADLEEIKKFLLERALEEQACIESEDDDMPTCPAEERWNSGNKFAVMKPGRKSALKLFDSKPEADEFSKTVPTSYVEERKGEDKRCNDYCLACQFCEYYRQNHKEEN